MMTTLQRMAEAARESGWEAIETFGGPRYVRRTSATFGTVTETIDIYVTGGKRQAFHHAWYTRQTPAPLARRSDAFTITDARYYADQIDDVLAKFTLEA